MDEATRARAEARYEEALGRGGLRDPREQFRDWMHTLRERDADAFGHALRYFDEVLVERVADPSSDPVAEWIEYGRRLAEQLQPGRLTVIDETGRAHDYTPPPAPGALVLHLPEDARSPASILSLPRDPSPAQRATCDLLVLRKLAPG